MWSSGLDRTLFPTYCAALLISTLTISTLYLLLSDCTLLCQTSVRSSVIPNEVGRRRPANSTTGGSAVNPISHPNSLRNISFDGCGDWQAEYIKLHDDILTGRAPPRYAVSVAVGAGLADRLVGIISEFYYALVTQRAFQITAGNQPAFEVAWDSPYINWLRPNDSEDLVKHMNNEVHDGETCRKCKAEIPPGLTANNSFQFLYLTNRHKFSMDFFQKEDWNLVKNGGQAATVFISSNRGRTYLMFKNPHHADQIRRWGIRPDKAFACAFDFLFRPKQVVQDLVAKELAALKANQGALKIGVNVRVGDSVFINDSTSIEKARIHIKCAEIIEKTRKIRDQKVIWYFISDSLQLKRLVKKKYGEKVLTNTKAKIIHPNCALVEVFGKGACGDELGTMKDPRILALQSAAAQLLIFSNTRYQVVSKDSGFGRAGAWLSPTRHQSSLELYEVGSKTIRCGPSDTTPLKVSALTWSGI